MVEVTSRGELFGGQAAISRAHAGEEVKEVRLAVLNALARDRQAPPNQMQIELLDGYLAATGGGGHASGRTLGGSREGPSVPLASMTASERRDFLAARVSARLGQQT